MLIRREAETDIAAVDAIHHAAFTRTPGDEPPEVELIRRLRADPAWIPALSLVAELPTGILAGHVACTLASIDDTVALGLGPLGVLPEHQRHGVGTALMHAVVGAADALEFAVVVLLGAVDYYSAFGFVPARSLRVVAPDPTWGDYFQARPLHAWHGAIRGNFSYATPFNEM